MYIMSFYEKYLKYKTKYLELKAMMGGNTTDEVNKYSTMNHDYFFDAKQLTLNKMLIEEFKKKLANSGSTSTMPQVITYLNALDGVSLVYHGCANGGMDLIKGATPNMCAGDMKRLNDLYDTIVRQLSALPIFGSQAAVKNLIAKHAFQYNAWRMKPIITHGK